MPQYMMLIYNPVQSPVSEEELPAQHERWNQYTQALRDAGLFLAGDALARTEVATTVRVRDGETHITDGPFAETKEFLAGYYLVEAPDLDTVLDYAARVPNIEFGSLEVRPVWDPSQSGAPTQQAHSQA